MHRVDNQHQQEIRVKTSKYLGSRLFTRKLNACTTGMSRDPRVAVLQTLLAKRTSACSVSTRTDGDILFITLHTTCANRRDEQRIRREFLHVLDMFASQYVISEPIDRSQDILVATYRVERFDHNRVMGGRPV